MRIFNIITFIVVLLSFHSVNGAEITAKKQANTKSTTSGYSAEVVPKKMTVQQKKERFKALMVPAVQKVYAELNNRYLKYKGMVENNRNRAEIEQLKEKLKAKTDTELLAAVKPHPVSIVLAQAAMESAWATSRFFREAKNTFGIWSFDKNEPRIAAGEKRGKKTIWLKKYKTIEDSIRDNYRVLARGDAFKRFRSMRLKTSDPFELVKGLDKYSELGSKYGKELASVIRYNKFTQFDLK
jgi:Bax protein